MEVWSERELPGCRRKGEKRPLGRRGGVCSLRGGLQQLRTRARSVGGRGRPAQGGVAVPGVATMPGPQVLGEQSSGGHRDPRVSDRASWWRTQGHPELTRVGCQETAEGCDGRWCSARWGRGDGDAGNEVSESEPASGFRPRVSEELSGQRAPVWG